MRKFLVIMLAAIVLASCQSKKSDLPADYVDPFIGTGGHGHTYPGAMVPFGMVQLSPDTRKDSWDGCSGYHYSDSHIFGFSHTHLSGTGPFTKTHYNNVLFMPTVGDLQVKPGIAKELDYLSEQRWQEILEGVSEKEKQDWDLLSY